MRKAITRTKIIILILVTVIITATVIACALNLENDKIKKVEDTEKKDESTITIRPTNVNFGENACDGNESTYQYTTRDQWKYLQLPNDVDGMQLNIVFYGDKTYSKLAVSFWDENYQQLEEASEFISQSEAEYYNNVTYFNNGRHSTLWQ